MHLPNPWYSTFLAAALAAGVTFCAPTPASATVVERVAAVVGDHAILLSDLRNRAKPALLRIHQEIPPGAPRNAAISQLYKAMLERMVDEELEQRAASRSRVVVSAQEVDEALGRIAAQNDLEVEQVVAEAARAGLSEDQYRGEVRRQVLEAKLLNLRLQGRIRVTDEDLRSAYQGIVVEERRKLPFRAAWVVIEAPRALTRNELERRRKLAEHVAAQARAGTHFGALARTYSQDPHTREAGGLLPPMVPGRLPEGLDRVALGLEVGEVSTPIRVDDNLVVLTVVERQPSKLPSFDEARRELAERVYLEKMNKARRHWLDGLRRRTHVEIRL